MNKEIEQRIHEFAEKMYQAGYQAGYEEKQKRTDEEILVGDEVYIIDENNKSVVIKIFNAPHGPVAMLLSGDAKWIDVGLQYLNKTGKHYGQIEEVLEQLRRDENNADNN